MERVPPRGENLVGGMGGGQRERVIGKRIRTDEGDEEIGYDSEEGEEDKEKSWMNTMDRMNQFLDALYVQGGEMVERIHPQHMMQKVVNKLMRLHGEMLEKVVDLQEENRNLWVENMELKMAGGKQGVEGKKSYAQAVMSLKEVGGGKSVSRLPPIVPHKSAEKVVIIKPKEKGTRVSRNQHELLRNEVRHTVREDVVKDVVVIRPIREGGYAMVIRNERVRDELMKDLKDNIGLGNVEVIAPRKKWSRFICRDALNEEEIKMVLADCYGRNNEKLCRVEVKDRRMQINVIKIGWILEVSGAVAKAIEGQGFRIRYGWCKEIIVDKFIPLQQCFKCCQFGHIANNCKSKTELCRMCGKRGYAGRECPNQDRREKWKCYNCQRVNKVKSLRLDVNHAAAQLHKCKVAKNERAIRRLQMQRDGVVLVAGREVGDVLGVQGLKEEEEDKTRSGAKSRNTSRASSRKGSIASSHGKDQLNIQMGDGSSSSSSSSSFVRVREGERRKEGVRVPLREVRTKSNQRVKEHDISEREEEMAREEEDGEEEVEMEEEVQRKLLKDKPKAQKGGKEGEGKIIKGKK